MAQIVGRIDEKYQFPNEKVIEMTSFAFSNFWSVGFLFTNMGDYFFNKGIRKGFGLVDGENLLLRKVYLKNGAYFSIKFSKFLFFRNYGKIKFGKLRPTNWKVVELSELSIKSYLDKKLNSIRKTAHIV